MMRRDIRSWSEMEEVDDLVIHVGGYEVTAVVENSAEVRESASSTD